MLADCEGTRGVLERYLLPWLPRTAASPKNADAVFRIERGEDGAGFQVRVDGRVAACVSTLTEVVSVLQEMMDEAIVQRITGSVVVHAGAVAYGGAAVLLPGSSHAGKSTLVAELLGRGCTYFSDEYALLDGEGRLHSYPRALMMRDSQGEHFPQLAAEWNAATGRHAERVGLVMALEHAPGAAWSVRSVPQSEMVLTLLKHTPQLMADSGNMVSQLARTCAGAECYAGVRGEAADAADRILSLLAQRP
ncbi:MAG: hypothetical protein LAP87_08150 [Acidobacteriia bacterium]|nr:hypothetical protein [Terriglobia bacterium]